MLRVCNSAHEPPHSPRTSKSPNAEILRKQIVGMLSEDQEKENDKPMTAPAPMIYQIKRKGAIATIIKPENKTERQLERIKRSHLKFIRESNSNRTKEFPTIENYVLQGEAKDSGRHLDDVDPAKRHWALPGDQKHESKAKNVRFHIHDEHKNVKVTCETDMKDKDNTRMFCEVRGSAIQSTDKLGRSIKPSLRQRRAEAAKRQATIHTSLQLFKRRLKLNHECYIAPSITINHDNDYIIRRVPLNNNANIPVPRASSAAKPVIEPRLTIDTSQRPKSSISPCLNVQKTHLKVRPQSSPERYPKESHLLRPRLEDNSQNITDNNFFQEEEHETVANVVNTYFVEQSKPKPTQFYQSSLSTHNIDVHNSLTSCPDARMKLANCDHKFDNRFLRWLKESSANSEEARRAAMRSHPEPPKSPLQPLDHSDTEL